MDFAKLDKFLDDVQPLLLRLASEHALKQPAVERWRWDEPAVSLTWLGPENISRNMRAVIDGETLAAEVNAWQDEDEEGGRQRVRYWKYEHFGLMAVPVDRDQLWSRLEEAYRAVSSWKRNDLKRVVLTPGENR